MLRQADIAGSAPNYPKPGYAWFVVAVLMIAYLLALVDRIILTLLVAPIQEDMGLSDTQISLLHGMAFALFYTLLGFPLGRLVDRLNRVNIIAWGVAVWSLMTALCGVAKNFTHLFLARIGVGVGEAALSPAAYSLISDYFPPDKRSRALSVYVAGSQLGIGISFLLGGLLISAVSILPDLDLPILGKIHSWQLVFFIVGLPGLLFLLILKLVKEPARQGKLDKAQQNAGIPLRELGQFLTLNKRTFISIFLSIGFTNATLQAQFLWLPTFLYRTYGMEATDSAGIIGAIFAIGGVSGTIFAGWLADYWQSRDKGIAIVMLIFGTCALAILPTALAPLMPIATWVFIALVPAIICYCIPTGLAVSAIQQVVPNELRGQISALYLFTINVIGLTIGPTGVALLTDYYFQDSADLRYSLAISTTCFALGAALAALYGIQGYRHSLERAKQWHRG